MKHTQSLRALALVCATALFFPLTSHSQEVRKLAHEIGIEKSVTEASEEAKPSVPEIEVEAAAKKPPKKRLFSRLRKTEEPEKPAASEKATPEPRDKKAKKLLTGFFRRSKSEREAEPPISKPGSTPSKEPAAEDEAGKQPRRQLFKFRKDKEKPELNEGEARIPEPRGETTEPDNTETDTTELATEPKPESESEPNLATPNRKRLFGRLFAKKPAPSAPQEEKAAAPNSTEAAADEPEPDKSLGGSLFGFLKKDSKEFAKADKTKLGKSLENRPGPASEKAKNAGGLGWYVVNEPDVPFYALGPGQPLPPEQVLDRGSMLTVTKGGWGWCNVRLDSGELGVVSSEAIRPATVAEVTRHTEPVATASKRGRSLPFFNILHRGLAPAPALPTGASDEPIRNFGLLPPLESGD